VHVVRRGENLWRISRWYEVDMGAVAKANRIADPTRIQAGQRLWIPSRKLAPVSARAPTRSPGAIQPRGRAGTNRFIWPIKGTLTSRFGRRKFTHHDGIDIAAREGTPVRAVEAGRVVHSGNKLSGYGNLIIIKHAGSLASVYAHNRRNLVRVGQFVDKGDVIAEVGHTGRASAAHLHFEVRRKGKPEDPMRYLP
jgi:lipoprotein NlpD